MKRWRFFVLIIELMLFAVILVLPQVALPDFAFHDGTAPVAARARICDPAHGVSIGFTPQMLPSVTISSMRSETSDVPAPPPVHSRLSRLCVLIC